MNGQLPKEVLLIIVQYAHLADWRETDTLVRNQCEALPPDNCYCWAFLDDLDNRLCLTLSKLQKVRKDRQRLQRWLPKINSGQQ